MAQGSEKKIVAIIPARFDSTRFPGKMLAPLAGKPLVLHAYERTLAASLVQQVIVATDSERIVEALRPHGVDVIMTRGDHTTGTDRIAEVAATLDADIIVNVQGDEALIDPGTIDNTIRPLLESPELDIATARRAIDDPAEINDPNIVKVVCDAKGHALYFSRAPIPYIRDADDPSKSSVVHWQHIGLYVFRKEFLLAFAAMEPTPLECLEKLEQLRVLENGHTMAVVQTQYRSIGVDTPEDIERARRALEAASLK